MKNPWGKQVHSLRHRRISENVTVFTQVNDFFVRFCGLPVKKAFSFSPSANGQLCDLYANVCLSPKPPDSAIKRCSTPPTPHAFLPHPQNTRPPAVVCHKSCPGGGSSFGPCKRAFRILPLARKYRNQGNKNKNIATVFSGCCCLYTL